MAEANSNLTDLTSVLARGLTTQCNTSRAPANFEASLETACSEPENSISRTFLRAGFQAWFAYFLASEEGNTDGLERLLLEDLANVASHVARLDLHESVRQLFSHLFRVWRGKKRLVQVRVWCAWDVCLNETELPEVRSPSVKSQIISA
ncbi:hypothetical protein NXS19_002861 [Fusarium pseudograminearum]|nr:hypothetical protein NXS19_002861 [Fusarium pseudograminearum]